MCVSISLPFLDEFGLRNLIHRMSPIHPAVSLYLSLYERKVLLNYSALSVIEEYLWRRNKFWTWYSLYTYSCLPVSSRLMNERPGKNWLLGFYKRRKLRFNKPSRKKYERYRCTNASTIVCQCSEHKKSLFNYEHNFPIPITN